MVAARAGYVAIKNSNNCGVTSRPQRESSMSSMYSSALAITSIMACGRSSASVFASASSEAPSPPRTSRGHHPAGAAGFADHARGLRVLTGCRDHHHEIGGGNLVDQIAVAAGEVAQPAGNREALAGLRLRHQAEAVKNVAEFHGASARRLTMRSLGRRARSP